MSCPYRDDISNTQPTCDSSSWVCDGGGRTVTRHQEAGLQPLKHLEAPSVQPQISRKSTTRSGLVHGSRVRVLVLVGQNRTWWNTVESLTDTEATQSATVSYWPSVLLVPTLSTDRWTLNTLSQHHVGDVEEVA